MCMGNIAEILKIFVYIKNGLSLYKLLISFLIRSLCEEL
jgi:hypothetical protein